MKIVSVEPIGISVEKAEQIKKEILFIMKVKKASYFFLSLKKNVSLQSKK